MIFADVFGVMKIGLLEPSEVETDPLNTDGRKIVQIDGPIVSFIEKNNFGNRTVRTVGSRNKPSTDRQTDTVYWIYRYQVPYLSKKKIEIPIVRMELETDRQK